MNLHKMLLIAGCCFLVALGLAIYRDVTIYEGTGTPDLRNRVVGARLQQDGISPYYFKWHPGDSLRYYDGGNIVTIGQTNITASPFFHNLMYPLASYMQRTTSRIWLVIEYLFVLVTVIIAWLLAKNNAQKIAIMIACGIYVFTETWITHIAAGQMYIMLSMLAMIIYYCLTKRENKTAAFIGGLSAIVMLLTKPNLVLFLIPFLFLINRYSRKYLLVFFTPVILVTALHFSFESNRTYWRDYFKVIPEIVKENQTEWTPAQIEKIISDRKLRLLNYEGWNYNELVAHDKATHPVLRSENGNVYIIYKLLFNRKMSMGMMNFLSVSAIIVLLALFLLMRKKFDILALPNAALLGYCIYMAVDLNSPICRHQYYGSQWFFPILLAGALYTRANKWFYVPLLAGLVLNVMNTDYILMEHSLGEYIILVTLICLSLTRKLEPIAQP
jgi:hypothetical protein